MKARFVGLPLQQTIFNRQPNRGLRISAIGQRNVNSLRGWCTRESTRQRIAAFGFAAAGQYKWMAVGKCQCDVKQIIDGAAFKFEFQLANRLAAFMASTVFARDDLALVHRHFNFCASRPCQPPDVAAEKRTKLRRQLLPDRPENCLKCSCHQRLQFQRLAAHRKFDFFALVQSSLRAAAAFHGLQPAPAILAQPQTDARRCQCVIGCVEVDVVQPFARLALCPDACQ